MLSPRHIYVLGVVSALSLGGYLLVSQSFGSLGFPLDDAWIHQTYARNLAHGEWAYQSGAPSGGSTGPLWSGLLAIGYLLNFSPYFWTYLLGWLSLWSLGILGLKTYATLYPAGSRYSIWLGLLLMLEWHLVWMAGSGMETLLYTLLATGVLTLILEGDDKANRWVLVGGCIGLSVWLRPDGITLWGPVLWVWLFSFKDRRAVMRIAASAMVGFLMFFIPYLVFNFHVAGSWWPNTFFAKQAEYAELRNMPIIKRLFDQSLLPAIGVGVTLLPGFFLLLVETLRRKRNVLIAVILWIGGYIFMYAWRLPVTYQHGRYVMPVMPALFILGFVGMAKWIFSENKNKWEWIVKRTWIVSTVVVLGVFWFLGARAYGRDVGFIETEMVATACWMDRNLPKEALVAVHDIGAVGYFGSHKILDLAGLISPDVIPFIRDETRLQDYLDIQEVDYLVTFPDWYPLLTTQATMVFQTDGSIAPALGHENMAVFRWSGR